MRLDDGAEGRISVFLEAHLNTRVSTLFHITQINLQVQLTPKSLSTTVST